MILVGCSGSSFDSNASDTLDNGQIDSPSVAGNGSDTDSLNGSNNDEDGPPATTLQPVEASLTVLADRTLRLSWQTTPDATVYRVLENPDGVSGFTDISGDLPATATFYDHSVSLFSRANAQYTVQSCSGDSCVNSDPVLVLGTLNDAISYIKASSPAATSPSTDVSESDEFGVSLAISNDGNTLMVGAPAGGTGAQTTNDLQATGAGTVYVFVRNNAAWQLQALLTGSNTETPDRFGHSVSISGDGNTLAVGAPGEASAATGIDAEQGDNSAERAGAVYTFVRTDSTWQQQAYLKAGNTRAFARFGWDVSLNASGDTLAVGARDENSSDSQGRGAVYVFSHDGGSQSDASQSDASQSNVSWQQQALIKAGTQAGVGAFGERVELSADGDTLAIGNSGEDSTAEQSGAVYVYVRNDRDWSMQAFLKADNAGAQDQFGSTLSLSGDGNTLAVGAATEDGSASGINADQSDDSARDAGAAYVFVRQGDDWQQQTYLKASNPGVSDLFGSIVILSTNGNTLAVSALGEDSTATGINGDQQDGSASNAGAVYLFVQTSGVWRQSAYLKASNTGVDDRFGNAMAISADGDTLAVGARGEDSAATGINGDASDNSVDNAGAVYVY